MSKILVLIPKDNNNYSVKEFINKDKAMEYMLNNPELMGKYKIYSANEIKIGLVKKG